MLPHGAGASISRRETTHGAAAAAASSFREGESERNIENLLCDELLFCIFSCGILSAEDLPRISRVCRRWKDIANDRAVRRKILLGQVYTLGVVSRDQRGSSLPVKCLESLKKVGVVAISAGPSHSLFVTMDGAVYSHGDGSFGQLGHGDQQHAEEPKLVAALRRINVIKVVAGPSSSFAITREGQVFAFGSDSLGALGHGNKAGKAQLYLEPKRIEALKAERIVDLAASKHTLAVTDQGQVFAFGYNAKGQLGLGDLRPRALPERVTSLKSKFIVSASAGDCSSYVLTREGQVFGFGRTAGLRNEESKLTPHHITEGLGGGDNALSIKVTAIAAGNEHILMVTDKGKVWSAGVGSHGRLGCGQPHVYIWPPVQITHLDGEHVVAASASAYHSIVLTRDGKVFTFGGGLYGKLGHNDTCQEQVPRRVQALSHKFAVAVSAGVYYSLVLTRS